MFTDLEYRERENEKGGDRPAKLNEKKSDRELEREIKKQRRHFLLEEQHEKFVATVTKWEMLADTKLKMSVRHFLQKTCNQKVSWSFTLQSCKTAAKKFTEKSVLHPCSTWKVAFLLIVPIVVFSPFSLPSPLSITRFSVDFIFCVSKL